MSFTVEYSDDGGSTFQTIQFGSFDVEYGLSDVLLAPLAAVDASRQAGASTGDRLRIQENGSNIFTGRLTTGGEVRADGQTRLQAEHDIYSVFADSVSITVSDPTDEDVYNAALSAANGGSGYTLNYVGAATSLADDYDVDDRKVKRVFKDMTDRTDRVFYVGVGDTITVAPRGDGGQFADLNAGDGFRVEKYNPGDIDTVRNAVTVNGTGGEQVSSTATDSTSISDFGRRAKVYNFSYIRSAGEASSMASELLIPNPLADAELLLGRSISGTTDLQVNTTIDFDDPDGSGASDVLTVEKQTISPGATTVRLGEGAGVSIANVRRDNQSVEDTTEPGSVYNSDRIADNAVESSKLVDTSVTEQKLADLAVATDKLQNNAVINGKLDDLSVDTSKLQDAAVATAKLENNAVVNGKLDDLSVSETKIQDGSISTPKIIAGAITASEIAADTITASEIAVGVITASEIAADTITAAEIAAGVITATEIKSNTITAGEIDADTITAAEIAAGTITALEIDADTITAAEIAAGTITALEIDSDTITANEIDSFTITSTQIASRSIIASRIDTNEITGEEIDALDLTTNELTVGTDTNNDIEFTEVDFDTAIVPETDGACQVGDDFDRFSNMFAVNMIANAGIFEQLSVDEGTSFEIESREFTNGVGLVPSEDNENVIGNDSTNEAFSSMAAHNFITSTPEPLSGVDASDITDYTWRQPPEYCAQRKATASDDCEYRHQNPDSGIDLPHITNYLFEICKDQQSKIESLESTVDDLESRLADLEAKQE